MNEEIARRFVGFVARFCRAACRLHYDDVRQEGYAVPCEGRIASHAYAFLKRYGFRYLQTAGKRGWRRADLAASEIAHSEDHDPMAEVEKTGRIVSGGSCPRGHGPDRTTQGQCRECKRESDRRRRRRRRMDRLR